MAVTIQQLAKLKREDLTKEGVFEEIRDLVYNPQYFYEMINAILIRRQLNKLLRKEQGGSRLQEELNEKYNELLIYLDFAVLPELKEEELKKLFKEHFFFAIKTEIDLENRFDLAFLKEGIDYIVWESRRMDILRGMKESEENINWQETGGEIMKVKDWLNAYDGFEIKKEDRDELDRINFLQSQAAKFFSKGPREYLVKTLEAYDLVKYGLRWKKKAIGMFLAGKKEKEYHYIPPNHYLTLAESEVKPSSPSPELTKTEEKVDDTTQITKNYQGDTAEQKKIEAVEKKYPLSVGFAKLSEDLQQAMFKKDKIQLIAVLRVLAKKAQLNKLLLKDRKSISLFEDYLESLQKPDLLEGFRLTPDQENFMVLFLRYVLEKRMGLVENESARIGMQLGNLMRQAGIGKYMKMAYLDSGSEEFRWK